MLTAAIAIRGSRGAAIVNGIVPNISGFSQVAASFAFSMMGFMAAAMALFSILGQSKALRKYRESGLLSVLLLGIAVTILELAATFTASLQLFVTPVSIAAIKCVSLALLACVGMVVVTTLPIVALQVRASSERQTIK